MRKKSPIFEDDLEDLIELFDVEEGVLEELEASLSDAVDNMEEIIELHESLRSQLMDIKTIQDKEGSS